MAEKNSRPSRADTETQPVNIPKSNSSISLSTSPPNSSPGVKTNSKRTAISKTGTLPYNKIPQVTQEPNSAKNIPSPPQKSPIFEVSESETSITSSISIPDDKESEKVESSSQSPRSAAQQPSSPRFQSQFVSSTNQSTQSTQASQDLKQSVKSPPPRTKYVSSNSVNTKNLIVSTSSARKTKENESDQKPSPSQSIGEIKLRPKNIPDSNSKDVSSQEQETENPSEPERKASDASSVADGEESKRESFIQKKKKRQTVIIYSHTRSTLSPQAAQDISADMQGTSLANENVNLMYSEREADTLKEIFSFMITKESNIIKELFILKVELEEVLIDSLLTMSFVTSNIMALLRIFIEEEFEECARKYGDEENVSLFRDTTVAAQMIRQYFKIVGSQYLQETLGDVINEICITERKVSLEINPSFTDPDELEINRRKLEQKVLTVIDKLTNKESIDKMPIGMRVVIGYVAEFARKMYPNKAYSLIGEILIMRYFNPAILNPDDYGLAKGKSITSISRRNLTLISKTLQNLAGGTQFGNKEQFMTVLNETIASTKPVLEKYFIQLEVPASTKVPVASELNVISVKDLHVLHKILFQNRERLSGLIGSQNNPDKVGTYQSKVSFSFLGANERQYVQSLLEERNEEASFINWVDKKKRNKVQKRLLVVGMNRIMSVKPSGRVAREAHSLDLVEIKSFTSTEVELVFKNFSIIATTEYTDDIINSIRRAYEYNFFSYPESIRFKVSVQPSSRLATVRGPEDTICGGFVVTYRSLCDYHKVVANENLCWDIENLYQDSRSFDLSKFQEEYEQPLIGNDLLPVFDALKYNEYFTSIIIKNCKIEKKELIPVLTDILRFNNTMTELTLADITMTVKDGFSSILEGLCNRENCNITSLNFSNSQLEDKGIATLANFLKKHDRSLIKLDLSNTGGSSKAYQSIISAIVDNSQKILENIETLSLANNWKIDISLSSLVNQLCSKNMRNLKNLYFGSTNASLKSIFDGLLYSKSPIKLLDISFNRIVKTEDVDSMVTFFQSTSSLESLSLKHTSISPENLQRVLLAINTDLSLGLDLSENNLGANGAKVISKIAYKLNSMSTLNLADNDFGDEGISDIANGFKDNYSIISLNLNGNFKGGKKTQTAVNSLIKMISSDCSIQSLHIAAKHNHPLKHDLIPFIDVLASNTSLTEIDISGHQIGNTGVIALAKSLQLNGTLVRLFWDENETGLIGFKNIKYALKINKTLRHMPLPVADISALLRDLKDAEEQKKLQTTIQKIERSILNNQMSRNV